MLWDAFATVVIVLAVAVLVWDQALRGLSGGMKVVAVGGVLVIAAASWALARERVWAWPLALLGFGVVGGARRRAAKR